VVTNRVPHTSFAEIANPDTNMFYDKSILITGGTGSFGRKWVRNLLTHSNRDALWSIP